MSVDKTIWASWHPDRNIDFPSGPLSDTLVKYYPVVCILCASQDIARGSRTLRMSRAHTIFDEQNVLRKVDDVTHVRNTSETRQEQLTSAIHLFDRHGSTYLGKSKDDNVQQYTVGMCCLIQLNEVTKQNIGNGQN